MDNIKIWNKIVSEYEKFKFCKENEVQKLWEGYFSNFFDYERECELFTQVKIHVGASDKYADIVIKNKNSVSFVVELKQYSFDKNDDYESQLFSYMCHPDIHCEIGILICNKIHLFTYNFSNNEKLHFEIPFEKDFADGIEFINLFSKENFNFEKISNYITEKCEKNNQIQAIKNKITSEFVKNLIIEHFAKDFSENEIESILEDFNITVVKKQNFNIQNQQQTNNFQNSNTNNSSCSEKDSSKYSFSGLGFFVGKCKFPFEVVKNYVQNHPNISYQEILNTFPSKESGVSKNFIKQVSELTQDEISRHRYIDLKNPLILGDGTKIVVSNQYTPGRIANFIKHAQSLGYEIIGN